MDTTAPLSGVPTGFVLPPLDGIDISDKKDLTQQIYAINICMISLVTIFLFLRLYSRLVLVKQLQVEDVLVIVGTIVALTVSGLCLYATQNLGLGVHVWLTDLTTIVDRSIVLVKILFSSVILYSFALTLAKCSVVILYLRIFGTVRWFRTALISIVSLMVIFFGLTFFITIFQCRPVGAAFDFRIAYTRETHCIVLRDYLYVAGGVNVLTDALLIVLPMPLVWNLTLELRKRMLIMLLFGLGTVGCVASIVRLTTLHSLGSTDVTFNTTEGLLWTVIETDVALMCASGPAIKPLIVHFFPRFFKTITSRIGRSRGHGDAESGFSVSNIDGDASKSLGITFKITSTASRNTQSTMRSVVYPLQRLNTMGEDQEDSLHLQSESRPQFKEEPIVTSRPSLSSLESLSGSFNDVPLGNLSHPRSPTHAHGRLQIFVNHELKTDVEKPPEQ